MFVERSAPEALPSQQGDLVLRNFRFSDGQTMPELRIHYTTWGQPKKDARGRISNAVLLLHGTLAFGGIWGTAILGRPSVFLGPAAPLDIANWYVIAPDMIGCGKSSRPSDGLRMSFPKYNIEDVARADTLLLKHLGVEHLRLVVGASLGGRLAWQLACRYPDLMDGIVAMMSSPFPCGGRVGAIHFFMEALIKDDPAFKGGAYTEPTPGARRANQFYAMFQTSSAKFEMNCPTRADSERWVKDSAGMYDPVPDATNIIYQLRASDGFDAWSMRDKIKVPVFTVNSAGDDLAPKELGHSDRVRELPRTTVIDIPESVGLGHFVPLLNPKQWAPQMRRWIATLPERAASIPPTVAPLRSTGR